ncbi:Phosphatidylinositol-3-phosphatase SAC1 [Malassezia yamatoensis]|uniref:Phosphatidylinositol-3-phosphatase SAC1 n=1 Tax=Malassezia yamatoensis TaxID=253288 RepID=A0AAJ5YQ68_9BASI|nr:Phosphatidylinositol-3-phosphatase SAC1 [Malassezia yamatoensis]
MYADREESIRGRASPSAGREGGQSDLSEREKELQEQLRRRAVDSRRRDGAERSPMSPPSHDSRTMRRRGENSYEDRREQYQGRRDFAGYRRDPPPRSQRGDYRSDYRRDDTYRGPRRRSASPPKARSPSRNDDYESRSVFCSNLPSAAGERDLGEFFEENLGNDTVVFVQFVYNYHTGQNLHAAYVELKSSDLIYKALSLNGHTLFGESITVQNVEGARFHASSDYLLIPKEAHAQPLNHMHRAPVTHQNSAPSQPSSRLYVGNLQYDIGSEHVRAVFEPFGEVEEAEVYYDHATGKSKGFAFVQFRNADDAHRATEQLNGYELAGRQMRVGTSKARISSGPVRDRNGPPLTTRFDEGGGSGINSADKRAALMEKLARGDESTYGPAQTPPIPVTNSSALLLKHMFDPATETGDWAAELRDDIRMEAEKYGPVEHVLVEKQSPDGEVFVLFTSDTHAQQARSALHGRYFGGQKIEASLYVMATNTHTVYQNPLSELD